MSLQITFDKEHYKKRVKENLDNLLHSEILSIDPYSTDDKSLDAFFKKRSKNYIQPQSYTETLEIVIHNFCTIGNNNGHTTNEYNGIMYKTALISFGEDKTLGINYRLFRHNMEPISNIYKDSITPSVVNNYFVHSTISGINELYDNIFYTANNKQILYAYNFPVYDNKYQKCYKCYRLFALSDNDINHYNILRKQLVKSQYFILNHILKYTSLYALMTRMYINGNSRDWLVWSDPAKFFVEIFNKDYRTLFENKLQEITQRMVTKNIIPTDDF